MDFLGAVLLVSSVYVANIPANVPLASSHSRTVVVPLSAAARAGLAQTRLANATAGNTYAGSEICMTCHVDMRRWRASQHASAYIRPMAQWSLVPGKGVLANSLGAGTDDFLQGLDFNAISSAFDAYKPNAPKLSVRDGVYTITIGTLDLPVVYALQWRADTGAWEQLYCVRVPVADSPTGRTDAVYSSPLFYTSDGGWEAYTPEAFWNDAGEPLYGAGATTAAVVVNAESHDQNCVGCHATGTRSIAQNARGEWVFRGFLAPLHSPDDPGLFDYDGDGNTELMNIGCESCHGPGGNHVSSHKRSDIVNPRKLDATSANQICGQCHSVIASAPEGLIGWPYDEVAQTAWIPGSGPLEPFITDATVWWPDDKTGMDTSQYPELYKSSKPTFAAHPIVCFDCHDPHGPTWNPAQVIEFRLDAAKRVTIATRVEDDTLCLSCHAGHGQGTLADFSGLTTAQVAANRENHEAVGTAVSLHTHHPYAPKGEVGVSRCTSCHMARTQGPDEAQTLHGHTFEVLSPQKTLMFQSDGGMPNSCASSCHGTQVDKFGLGVDPNPMSWNDPFDVSLANELLKYYGPNGLWWKVDVGAGARAPQPALRRAQNRAGHHGVRHHRSTGTAK